MNEDKGKMKKILLNPVGGLYFNSEVKQFVYQRPVFNNIYIDSLVIDICIPLADMLKTIGFKIYTTRLLNKIYKGNNNKWGDGMMGESGQPRYRECCVQYLKSICTYESFEKEKKFIPEEIYNDGNSFLEKDFNSRINYAKYINADMMITIDATTYITDNGMEVICNKVVGSELLAHLILNEVAKRTRTISKGVSYAEEKNDMEYNKLTCPSIIFKVGSTADARVGALLIQGFFRQWISLGIFAGIWKYMNK